MMASPWLVRHPQAAPLMRLYCFSYAGGSAAAYAGWQALLGPMVEVCAVQLPGHGARMGEAPLSALAQVVEAVAAVIACQGPLPFAFFGHSLGALLAFELARHCMRHRLAMPVRVFVSGSDAPALRCNVPRMHLLSDAQFIAALRQYNGTPAELLAHRELMALVLPMIRADFALVENYVYRSFLRLPVPFTVLAGRDDPHVDLAQLDGWCKETSASCDFAVFGGDHFFINACRAEVVACVADALALEYRKEKVTS